MLKHKAKVDKAGEGGWYVSKSGGGSGRCYVCWYALMVTSKGLIVGAGGNQGWSWLSVQRVTSQVTGWLAMVKDRGAI